MENDIKNNLTIGTAHGYDEIKKLILSFEPIFPHLKEKISSFDEYAVKLAKYANVVYCRINDEIAGLLVFYSNDFNEQMAYISLIGVHKKWQGKNIAKILLEYCVNESLKCGMQFLKLEVDLDNERAKRFYLTNGFEYCNESNASSVHMCKKIK